MATEHSFEREHQALLTFLIEYIKDAIEEDIRGLDNPTELHYNLITIDLIAANMINKQYDRSTFLSSLRNNTFIGHSPEVEIDAGLIFDEIITASKAGVSKPTWEESDE